MEFKSDTLRFGALLTAYSSSSQPIGTRTRVRIHISPIHFISTRNAFQSPLHIQLVYVFPRLHFLIDGVGIGVMDIQQNSHFARLFTNAVSV